MDQASGQKLSGREEISSNIFCFTTMEKSLAFTLEFCLTLRVPEAPLHERIQLRLVPDKESELTEVRFWHEDELLGIQKVKNSDLNLVQF